MSWIEKELFVSRPFMSPDDKTVGVIKDGSVTGGESSGGSESDTSGSAKVEPAQSGLGLREGAPPPREEGTHYYWDD